MLHLCSHSANEASCLATLVPPSALLLLLVLRAVSLGTRRRQARSSPPLGHLLGSPALGLSCALAAVFVEPYLTAGHAPAPAWPLATPGLLGAICYALAWCLEPAVSALEPRGSPWSLAFHLSAWSARVVPLALGLSCPAARAHLTWWLPVEVGLLFATSAAAAAAGHRRMRCRCGTERATCEPLDASLIGVAPEQLSAREAERRAWEAELAAMERVVPAELGCGGKAARLWRLHGEMLEEAREVQRQARLAGGRAGEGEGKGRRQEEEGGDGGGGAEEDERERSIWHYLWALSPKLYLFSGVLCSLLLTASSFGTPYVQGVLFDVAVDVARANGTLAVDQAWGEAALPLLGAFAALQFCTWLFEVLVGTLYALAAHTALTRLRVRMYRNLVQQDAAFFDAHVSGELSSRLINDSGALQSLAQFTSQSLIQGVVRLAGSLVAMFATHPVLALLATVVTPLNWLLVRRAGEVQGLYGVVQNEAMARANAQAVEVLGAMRTVQANASEVREARRFAERLTHFLRVVVVTVNTQTAVIFAQLGLSKARDVLVLACGMHQLLAGRLTIGSFTAFTTYVSLYEQDFTALAGIWLNTKQTLIAAGRFLSLLQRRPAILPSVGAEPASCRGHLELRDVTFAYPLAKECAVLKGLSFEVEPGSVLALVGASGAGKTTVGRLIERFYDPQQGALLLDGTDFRALELRWLRRQIGFVEQEPILFDCSLMENIKYGRPDASDEAAIAAAERANADEFIRSLPEGYATRPGEKGVRISGGQKQRVAIARAISKEPRLLLLDEATSSLDSTNEAVVQASLEALMEGRATVVIAHRLSTVVRATRILVLSGGVAVESGTHAELSADAGSAYSRFMRHQLVPPPQAGRCEEDADG